MSSDQMPARASDLTAVLVLLLLVVVPSLITFFTGRAYLPRHPAAHDLPWSRTDAATQLAAEPYNRALNDKINLIFPRENFQMGLRRGLSPWFVITIIIKAFQEFV